MKLYKYVLVLVVALALSLPAGVFARDGSDDPEDTPEASESPDVSESPDASESPEASKTPDSDDDEDEQESETPRPSTTVKPSATVRPTRTPEREVEEGDDNSGPGSENSGRGSDNEREDEPRETPEILVPSDLEDDAANIASDDDDVRKIEVNEEEDRVEVKYRLRARLFGLIDVPYELEARVETKEGERRVEARGPWWLFLARDNSDEVQDALEADENLTETSNQGTVLSTIISILRSMRSNVTNNTP